jgi:tetratricopeptide (TPR) repeat protein
VRPDAFELNHPPVAGTGQDRSQEGASPAPKVRETTAFLQQVLPWLNAKWTRRYLPRLLIIMATALVWGHTVGFDFVWDDKFFIQRLDSIRSLHNAPEMFRSRAAQSSMPDEFVLFRPLRTVHYALLYQLGGGEPPKAWLFHLSNVLWHGTAGLLVYAVALMLFRRLDRPPGTESKAEWLALLAGLGFTVNPVVSETVCWAKSLDDLMATVFALAACRALLRWPTPRHSYFAALGFFVLAVYSKVSAVPFALFAFFVFRVWHGLPWLRACRNTGGFLAAALVFLAHHHWVIGRTSQTDSISGSYGQTLIDMLPVVPKYVRLLLGLPPFCIDYSYLQGGHAFASIPVLGGLALLISLALLGVWALRQREFQWVSLGLIWVGLFLLPVSNLMPMMQYMAERFLYLPLVGWMIALSALLGLSHRRRFTATLGGVLLVFWIGTAWHRSWIWRDELTLFVQSSQTGPKTARVEENAVAAFFELPPLKQVFVRDPANAKTFRPIESPGNWNGAVTVLRQANRLFPHDENVLNCLGIAYAKIGQPAQALDYLERVANLRPQSAQYWANLGQACLEAKAWDRAHEVLQNARRLKPDDAAALHTLAAVYWQQGDLERALKIFERLERLEPANAENAYWIRRAKLRLKPDGEGPPAAVQ